MSDHEIGHEIHSGVVADWSDDRDADFAPLSSLPPPPQLELVDYRFLADETWHQRGEECTGFALAAVANYLIRRRHDDPTMPSVSRRMLYEMAQKYDGEMHVEGSTLRGALKGWSRVGVASDDQWPYAPNDEHGAVHGQLTLSRILDGRTRPLMGYRRIKNNTVGVMQRALAEGHPLYVAARTHEGWYRLFLHNTAAKIERRIPADEARGIHAFVIIGYDDDGFVIHNSWGPEWGDDGYAVLPYDQWKWGATDTWVVHAGIDAADAVARPPRDAAAEQQTYRDMWPHLVVIDDDGQLAARGPYEMDGGSVKTLLYLFDEYTRAEKWTQRKLVVIADGGAHPTAATIARFKPLRDTLLAAQIYPIFLVWQTSWQQELDHELRTWQNYRSDEGLPAEVATKLAAAESRSQQVWQAIRARSISTCLSTTGAARLLSQSIAYKRNQNDFQVYGVSFGAGDLTLAPLASLLPAPLDSVIAVNPATTMHDFSVTYRGLLATNHMQHLTVAITGDDASNQVAGSELTDLVSDVWSTPGSAMRAAGRSAQRNQEWAPNRVPVLGAERHVRSDNAIKRFTESGRFDLAHIGATNNDSPAIHAFITDALTTQRQPPGPTNDGFVLPSDPLARAQAIHQQRNIGTADSA